MPAINVHRAADDFQPIGREIAKPASAIRFDAICKTFPAGKGKDKVIALDDVALNVAEGTVVGVIGRSGAGKSTLIRLVNGLEKPTRGRVIVGAEVISDLSGRNLREARRSIGMIFQHFNLLSSRTAAGNIAFPLELLGWSRTDIDRRVDELLELVDLNDKRNRYPVELSGGQKQRVGIARALATRPKVLLSDEATSALDPQTTRTILDLLAAINRDLGLTILLITHEMSVVRRLAHEVVVLEAGRIVEQGSVTQIFARPQHSLTRDFLADATDVHLSDALASMLKPTPIVRGRAVLRLTLAGLNAAFGLSRVARDTGADVALLAGKVDDVSLETSGTVIISVDLASLPAVQASVLRQSLKSEVLGYVK